MKNIKGFVVNHKKAITRVVIGGAVVGVVGILYKMLNKENDEDVLNVEVMSDEPVDVGYESIPTAEQE